MAEERTKADKPRSNVQLDDFTAKVVPDPAKPAQAQLVFGFLGASAEPNHTRIYSDASLSSYLEVVSADILHSEPLPKEQSSLGGSYVWLKRDAQVTFGSAGGVSNKGRFFEGPLATAYAGQFGPGAAFGGVAAPQAQRTWDCYAAPPVTVWYSRVVGCVPPSVILGCAASPACTITVAGACIASPNCPPPPAGGPVQGGGEAAQAAIQGIGASYAPGCWHSWNACPTDFGCGPHGTPHCPQFQGAIAGVGASYAPGCWHSWNACPTDFGCGPHGTPHCPQVRGAIAGVGASYAPGCWHSWNACPTDFGCGPHGTPHCPQIRGAIAGVGASYAPGCWHSWNACPTDFGCGPHRTPYCPQ